MARKTTSCPFHDTPTNTYKSLTSSIRRRPLLELPFVPFTVIFCHVIGTSSAADLAYLGGLVKSLRASSSRQSIYPTCAKQSQVFESLYNVAREYIQALSLRQEHVDVGFNSFAELFGLPVTNHNGNGNGTSQLGAFGLLDPNNGMEALGSGSSGALPYGQYLGEPGCSREDLQEVQTQSSSWELDNTEGAKLGEWFQKNQNMMRMMEVNL